jgi:hypothetical protein
MRQNIAESIFNARLPIFSYQTFHILATFFMPLARLGNKYSYESKLRQIY